MTIKVKPSLANNIHDITLDGFLVGHIYKRIQTYNLRRYFVNVWYEVEVRGVKVRDQYGNPAGFNLLRDARAEAEAILRGERGAWPTPEVKP